MSVEPHNVNSLNHGIILHVMLILCNSYTMVLRTGGQTWYNNFIPPTSV